ncbi:MAG: glycosyltransferase family 25 protein [Methylotenera sp.]|nr:glycosyltransferase family 25 protein [Methylotenera sp.]NOU39660.1 glycosyltransferase family 25 protein [Methylotenera sp.]
MNQSFFEYICVINLDARPDRWENMQVQFANLNIKNAHRFSAVSFDKLENNPPPENFKAYAMAGLQRKNEDANAEHQIKAMWGCLNSHVGAIAYAKSKKWPYVLILEDDCEFEFFTNKVMKLVTEQIKSLEWDMLYLGGNQKKYGLKLPVAKNLLSVTGVTLAHAYIVNASIYDKIIGEAPKAGMTIDDFYTKSFQKEIKTLLVNPPVAFQRPEDVSDISQVARRRKYNLTHLTRALKRFYARVRYS